MVVSLVWCRSRRREYFPKFVDAWNAALNNTAADAADAADVVDAFDAVVAAAVFAAIAATWLISSRK